ncbi:uncharacterized protein [Typha angustifolia]|uniref:uncharacterized protein isoform X1 n=1 Tax=Typha angustifolia TaxID=59011 RepID=UPI003C2AB9B7
MDDLMLGQEKRLALPPPTESLIGRLDQIDHRLRQLEEKEQLPESYFIADLQQRPSQHHHRKSLPTALHEVQIKGNLMDRLHLLEGRIRQLSFQLDKDSCVASTSAVRPTDENACIRPAVADKQQQMNTSICSGRVVGGPWRADEIFHLHAQKTKSKVKDSKKAICAAEKRTNTACRNEKRRMERTRLFRRWFPVGC